MKINNHENTIHFVAIQRQFTRGSSSTNIFIPPDQRIPPRFHPPLTVLLIYKRVFALHFLDNPNPRERDGRELPRILAVSITIGQFLFNELSIASRKVAT